MDQDKLTTDQDLIESCISVVGSAVKVSKLTGFTQEHISRLRNGHRKLSVTGCRLFKMALEIGDLKQELSRLKRRINVSG